MYPLVCADREPNELWTLLKDPAERDQRIGTRGHVHGQLCQIDGIEVTQDLLIAGPPTLHVDIQDPDQEFFSVAMAAAAAAVTVVAAGVHSPFLSLTHGHGFVSVVG